MSEDPSSDVVLALTAQIVSAHVSNHKIEADGLTSLIQQTYATLRGLGVQVVAAEHREPAVPVRRSVFPDYIVCLEDGKKLKMLKRHLQTAYGLSVEQYRDKWGLPSSYPMVAPNYAKHRSTLAKRIGLGRKPAPVAPAAAEPRRRRGGKVPETD